MNKVILMGRLTKDPDTRYTTTNKLVATFNLAVNKRFQEGADFISIVAWNKTGEFVSKYFRKGQQVGIIGRIQNDEYEDKDGHKKTKTRVIAEEVYFADSRKETGNNQEYSFEPSFNIIEDDDDLPF